MPPEMDHATAIVLNPYFSNFASAISGLLDEMDWF
jgi:hypothetical protein